VTATPLASVSFVESTGVQIVKALVIFMFVLGVVPMILLLERKLLGRFQARLGPNRVGPFGLLQPLADVLKLLSKEKFTPATAVPWMMAMAPAISIFTAVVTLAIVPFGDVRHHALFGASYGLYGIDVSIGILWAFAFGALAAVLCPAGQLVASAVLPSAGAPASALRRIDSLLLLAPAWAYVVGLVT